MDHPTVDIVLPCYNPPSGWSEKVVQTINEINTQLDGITCRLIIVNDGSRKGFTSQDADYLQRQLPGTIVVDKHENRGKGAALREGIRRSDATYCIYTDIDFPYTNDSLLAIYNDLSQGLDIVAGVKDASYYSEVPPGRRFISKFLRMLTSLFLGLKITDTQCGLKGMNQKGKVVFLSTTIDRYLFDLEFIYLASHQEGLRLEARTISLRPGITFSQMPLRILAQESLNFVRIIFKRFA